MNKTDLINAIAAGSGLSKADATKALNATTAAIADAVKAGDKVITSKYSGTEVKCDGIEYIIVKQGDILAIVE